jgi:hypothetical protein
MRRVLGPREPRKGRKRSRLSSDVPLAKTKSTITQLRTQQNGPRILTAKNPHPSWQSWGKELEFCAGKKGKKVERKM